MNNHNRWRISALASAIALLGSLASLQVHALALGRITVQSALGEPLRAEIDMADINADEASNLRVGVASAESFKAAGLEYSAAVTGLEVRLQRRADGRPYLHLSSSRAVNEPFVDLIIETNGSSGRMTRDYTMLFDPPKLRTAAGPIEPSAAVASRAATPIVAATSAPASPVRDVASVPALPPVPPVSRPAPAARLPVVKPIPAETGSVASRKVIVRPGDTASAIAVRNKPASVSLDQMLAAMLRSNPDAFVGGNVNIIKSGAVLDIPAEEILGTRPGEDRSVIAQSKDFNAFRRKLADGAPSAQVGSAERQAGGKLQATVEDRAAKPATPDKLTLSGGAVGAKAPPPDSSAATMSAGAAAAPAPSSAAAIPVAEGPPPVAAAAGVASASTAGIATPAAMSPSSAAGAVTPIASEPAPASSVAVASVPALVKKPGASVPAPAQASLIDHALDNPLLLSAAGGFLLLLGGLLFARYRQNKNKSHIDSSFLESRSQLDSFFGASGGQRIDTRASTAATGTSTAYSASQFDHAGDVDPVAEADVYLAYGRDQQAEEILKEAMRSHPTRVSVHAKLVEIYAKRRDIKAFDSIALEAFRLTQGTGAEWAHITKLGHDLTPNNPMYRSRIDMPGSVPDHGVSANIAASAPPALASAPMAASATSQPYDVDFSLHTTPLPQFSTSALETPSAFLDELDLDLDLDIESAPAPLMEDFPHAPLSASPPAKPPAREPDFVPSGLDFTTDSFVAPLESIQPEAGPDPVHSGMLEFDLSSLSLDLGPATLAPSLGSEGASEDPLEIKFLLAEEFRILGDSAGARSLADEVLVKAKGPLKAKVQAFLNTLS